MAGAYLVSFFVLKSYFILSFNKQGGLIMPKTKFQSIIFTLIMVFFMVFSMAIREMWVEYVVAFCLQIFFVGPLVRLIFRTLFRSQLADNAAPEAA